MEDDRKLLVVDDDQMMLDFATRVLASLGYASVTAPDAATALRVLEEDRDIRAVIIDLRLGRPPNGAFLVRQALAMRPDIRGLLTSGDHGALQSAAGEMRQDVELLTKPYRRHELADCLSRLL